VRGKIAKRLRKIARSLQRPVETVYGFGYHPDPLGDWVVDEKDPTLRRRPPSLVPDPGTGEKRLVKGHPVPRMLMLGDCERRAYQEAKKIYAGR
jgi:hypothetical protein